MICPNCKKDKELDIERGANNFIVKFDCCVHYSGEGESELLAFEKIVNEIIEDSFIIQKPLKK